MISNILIMAIENARARRMINSADIKRAIPRRGEGGAKEGQCPGAQWHTGSKLRHSFPPR
jgi:hypothetical protein